MPRAVKRMDLADLDALTRAELQKLAKSMGVKAVGKNADIKKKILAKFAARTPTPDPVPVPLERERSFLPLDNSSVSTLRDVESAASQVAAPRLVEPLGPLAAGPSGSSSQMRRPNTPASLRTTPSSTSVHSASIVRSQRIFLGWTEENALPARPSAAEVQTSPIGPQVQHRISRQKTDEGQGESPYLPEGSVHRRSKERASSPYYLPAVWRSGAPPPQSPVASAFSPRSSRHAHPPRPQHIPWAGEDPAAEQSSSSSDRGSAVGSDSQRGSSSEPIQSLDDHLDLLEQKMCYVPELQEGFWELQNVAQVIRNKEAWMATQMKRIQAIRLVLEEHYLSKRKAKQSSVEPEEGQRVADV